MPVSSRAWSRAALAALLLAVPGTAVGAGDDIAIKDIIPHSKVGTEVCFEGSFTGMTVDMKKWPSYAEQAQPKYDADGRLAASSQVHVLPSQSISHVALHLKYTNGRRLRNESWDMSFIVSVTSPSIGQELFAQSGCIWSGWDAAKEEETTPEFKLACWIECDGGSLRAVRIPGTRSLNVSFSRLFTQAGCEGGGRYTVGEGEASEHVAFRLKRAPLKACKSLKAWAARD